MKNRGFGSTGVGGLGIRNDHVYISKQVLTIEVVLLVFINYLYATVYNILDGHIIR
jgi:hypothetical protein